MPGDPVNAEGCLRSLAAEALLWAPHRPLFPDSLGLMAVANAFVMLGLLPEPRAEAVLADHKSALERMDLRNTWGVTKGELTVRLVVWLPLEHATAVIESVSAQDDLVSLQLYGHPWVHGEYLPMITRCFQVRAVDDAGNEHEGTPGDWQGFPGGEGSGSFWFWPPVPSARKSIRVTVSTLWEAAWADVELPR